ncbi:uncharacterized protein PHACADRAFT_177898 [Phanerochaete carnosa HHB-10118-sp]|uniref:F-box domain-containing protein n=1 Tax=Phanerochaete carnosa (strain HHB-10118-sp) TaxID=650164 RepID=K5WLR6_PHACS|nr:uncharacterized protein PHACADRAFT_177898 [Phanerochaete carnosa HHB-10118-sp]EKM51232.1 hypothetical protein PHACADRAFT_177898 [Phanerochaete carnosa HHB-10118-sp]
MALPNLFDHTRTLPPEVLSLVFDETDTEDLPSVLRASSALYAIAFRSLYREISNCKTGQKRVQLLQSLARASDPAFHPTRLPSPTLVVRLLSLDFHSNTVTANLLRLINRALRASTNLRELILEFSAANNFQPTSWCLLGTTFYLRRLYTSVGLDATLFTWLAHPNQRLLIELNLRGHQIPSRYCGKGADLSLPPDALPALASFRSVHLDSACTTIFLAGRPVQHVGLTLFPLSAHSALDGLCGTSVPVRRLTVLCLEEHASEALVAEIAARLPGLESLHVVVLMTPYTSVKLHVLASALTRFVALRYITFMAPDPPGADAFTVERERAVVVAWARACPTLRTVILPMGQVWYTEDGAWRCYADGLSSREGTPRAA